MDIRKFCTKRLHVEVEAKGRVGEGKVGPPNFETVVAPLWNSLPSSVTSSTSLTAFRQRLKSELFLQCFGQDCV